MVLPKSDTEKYMSVARDAARLSNCCRRAVGAVIVSSGAVIVSASNGTLEGVTPCNEGGCARCDSDVMSGGSYEPCLCTHAEQATVAKAARYGISTEGATMYCTLRPCLTCAKICLEAGIIGIIYEETIRFASDVESAYESLLQSNRLRLTFQSYSQS